MEFYDFTDDIKAHPGEYLLHTPSRQIVMCGAFNISEGTIRALYNGRLMEDSIENFQKIKMPQSSTEKRKRTRGGCGSCKK